MSRMAAKDRREALIAAAIRVMARDGVVKATTRAIAGEAQMPLGVFHYCFASREELLQEVIRRLTAENIAAARQAFAEAGDPATMITIGRVSELATRTSAEIAGSGRIDHIHVEPDETVSRAALDTGAIEAARPLAQRLIDALR